MHAKVGSFQKSTGAATATQQVTGLGFDPTVVFLWTAGQTAENTWGASYRSAFGFATATEGRSVGMADQDAADTSNVSRRYVYKALSIAEWGETLLAECDLSVITDGFELAWTTNNAVAYYINYLAIDPPDADIVDWTISSTGSKEINGTSFTPELVIHLNPSGTAAAPILNSDGFLSFGAMTTAGQWAFGTGNGDNQLTTISSHIFHSSAMLINQNASTMAMNNLAAYTSMDSDGFTVNVSAYSGSARQVSSLCLAGADFTVGIEDKTTGGAPVTESITGLPYEPAAVLALMGGHAVTSNTGVAHQRFSFGASDGTNERSIVLQSEDNALASAVDAYQSNAKTVLKAPNSTPSITAEADISLTSDGFDVDWTTNDGTATDLLWIAFGPVDSGATPKSDTDSQAIGSSEGQSLTAAIPTTDSQAIGSDEATEIDAAIPDTDSQAIGSSEDIRIAFSTTDANVIVSDESATVTVSISVTDSQDIGSSESQGVGEAKIGEDSQIIGSDEAVSITIAATDSQAIGSSEDTSLSVVLFAADSQQIQSSEFGFEGISEDDDLVPRWRLTR